MVSLNRLISYSTSVANSGLNLLLVFAIGHTIPTETFAQFTLGVVFGGPFAVWLAFGNDTLLARVCIRRPGFARLVSLVRIIAFVPVVAAVLALHSLAAAAGVCFVAGTAVQQRFYFEAHDRQLQINVIGVIEKVASIGGVAYFCSGAGGGSFDRLFWWIIAAKSICGGLISLSIISSDRGEIAHDLLLDGWRLSMGALPFLAGYVAIQTPAMLLVAIEPPIRVADFGMSSQIGAGMVSLLTLWQRPAVLSYINNAVTIRRELTLSVVLASATSLLVYLFVFVYGTSVKLLPESSVVHGFVALALVTAVLHPFEVRGYAKGRIQSAGLVVSGISALLVALPLSSIIGFWAVPVAGISYQFAIFLYHRLWANVDSNTHRTPD